MKKLLLITLLLVGSLSFSQEIKSIKGLLSYNESNGGIGVGLNYGFKANSMGIDVISLRTNSLLWGGGASFSFNSPEYRGIELNENYGWDIPNETKSGESYSFYGLCGYTFKNFFTYGKLGLGVSETVGYYNHYNQWHYKVLDTETTPLVGVGVGSLAYKLGVDNFNGVNVGILVIL